MGVALLVPVCYCAIRKAGEEFDRRIAYGKTYRETTATVRSKKHLVFDETRHSYVDSLGTEIERKPGDEQWRVYFELDNLDQIDEPRRSYLLEAEKKRIAKMGFLFSNQSKEWYDKIAVGDKLIVTYHPIGDDKMEIVSVANPRYPGLH